MSDDFPGPAHEDVRWTLTQARDLMVELFGITAEEAEGRLWHQVGIWNLESEGARVLISHETPEDWAYGTWYRADWWRPEIKDTLAPAPWSPAMIDYPPVGPTVIDTGDLPGPATRPIHEHLVAVRDRLAELSGRSAAEAARRIAAHFRSWNLLGAPAQAEITSSDAGWWANLIHYGRADIDPDHPPPPLPWQ